MLRSHVGRGVTFSRERLESMTRGGGWPNRCLIDYFDDQAKARSDKTYVIAHSADTGTRHSFTFAQFDAIVDRVAAGLARCGIVSGDVVSYQLPNWWEFLAISLACSRIGAVTNPLMPILRERELTFMLGLAESKILIVPQSFRGFDYPSMARAVQRAVSTLKFIVIVGGDRDDSFEQVLLQDDICPPSGKQNPNELLQLMYTSGTTGEPKGVMHSSNTLYANILPFAQRLKITDQDVIVCPTPLAHQLGYLYALLMPAMTGSTVVLQDVWNPAVCALLIEEYQGSFCLGATPFLADLADLPSLHDRDILSLRMFVSGGAPIPSPLVVRAKERLRAHIVSVWGMTEVSAVTTVHLDDRDELVSGTDGVALPHMEVGVFDEQDRELPRGQPGRLKVRGASVFLGYLKRPSLYNHNAEGWFDTGDLARMNDEGYIRITGRSKDVIIRGGENIPVVEIESILYHHPAVRAVAIVGMPDPRLGERAVAYMVVKPDTSIDLPQVTAFLAENKVARSYFPERVEILPEMPMTATGKIQKFVLREWARKLVSTAAFAFPSEPAMESRGFGARLPGNTESAAS
jgi:cyclohexanecarboxylate-CoA ligase